MTGVDPVYDPSSELVTAAQRAAISEARDSATSITGVGSADQALVRQGLPSEDVESGGGNSWGGTGRQWIQSGLTGDALNEVYSIDSDAGAEDKVLVFWGIANLTNAPKTSEIEFQDGVGSTFVRIPVERAKKSESGTVLFDTLIKFEPTEDGFIAQYAERPGDAGIVYLVTAAEPLGETVTTRERDR